jgi:cellulose synthase/poly-beta-1,6-N-acetylglucosamine synthase-like glycosyltransferase
MDANCGLAHELDIVQDLHHPSYKLVGALAWLTVGLAVVGALAFPRLFLAWARLFAFYLLARLVMSAASYLVGVARCYVWERRAEVEALCHQAGECGGPDDVHHVVIVPNYAEPVEILRRTLRRLAAQEEARRRLTVVLAMEGREIGARAKAKTLREQFADRFARILITVHPANQAGEIACKGSNQTWAVRQVKRELVDRLGLSMERLTLTSCDADSMLHPHYFAKLTRLFVAEPEPHRRFWYAPVFSTSNIWQVPAPIRLLSFPHGAGRLAELANPLSWPLPFSTYTLSFRLADEVGYWDPAVISDDWHMYLRCFLATHGQVRLVPIYLPTAVDAVEGETLWETLVSYYRQQVRHAWGAEDVAYILQQWRRSAGTPLYKRLFCLFWILHHHSLRSTSWFILTLGSLTSVLLRDELIITLPSRSVSMGWVQLFNVLGVVGGAAMWAVERTRCRSEDGGSGATELAQELLCWALMPVLALAFSTLPGLHAQTKMLFGSPLVFRRTPKGIRRRGRDMV